MKVLLLYPPEQQWPGNIVKPNGSLAYPYLGGALRDIGVETYVYDATVGDHNDNTDKFFGRPTKLPSGKLRTGVSDERILEVASNYDVIGITSIFSQQEAMALHCAKIIKKKFPNKVLFSGGVNAKSRSSIFFESGFDVIFTSEAENSIQQVAKIMQKNSRDFSTVGKIYFKNKDGKIVDQIEDVAYQSNTQEFWNSCSQLAGKSDYRVGGSFFDGKGQPSQVSAVSHGCPTTRFDNINVINTARNV